MWSELRERVAQYDSRTRDMRLCGRWRVPVASLKAKQDSSMTRGDANENEEQDRRHRSTAGELCIDAAWNQFGFETASPTTIVSEAMIFFASQPWGPKCSALARIYRSSLALANTYRTPTSRNRSPAASMPSRRLARQNVSAARTAEKLNLGFPRGAYDDHTELSTASIASSKGYRVITSSLCCVNSTLRTSALLWIWLQATLTCQTSARLAGSRWSRR